MRSEYDQEIHGRVSQDRSQDTGLTIVQRQPSFEADENDSKKSHGV